ncbi:MAG: hypothetical protein WCT30_03675, partial [Desulfurivibrionaceae bacterium]
MKSLWLSAVSEKKLSTINEWLFEHVLTYDHFIQAMVITCALLIAFLAGHRLKQKFSAPGLGRRRFGQFISAVLPLAAP